MGNKLRDIFSDTAVEMGGRIRFENPDAHKKFLEALQIVWEEGKTVKLDGVSSILSGVKNGQYIYPFLENKCLDQVIVAPSMESVPIELETELGMRTLMFRRYSVLNEIILETDTKAVVYIKLRVSKDAEQSTFTYKTQPELAKDTKEIIESYSTVLAFINSLFRDDVGGKHPEELDLIRKTKKYFIGSVAFYRKMQKIEQDFNLKFDMSKHNEEQNDEQELEELYALIYEKRAFRLSAKLNSKEGINVSAGLSDAEKAIGTQILLTFASDAKCELYGQTISFFTANLLINAVIKEVRGKEDGSVQLWYDDTDVEPMYISYTGFVTEEERNEELAKLMEHKEKYIEAISAEEYYRKSYNEAFM